MSPRPRPHSAGSIQEQAQSVPLSSTVPVLLLKTPGEAAIGGGEEAQSLFIVIITAFTALHTERVSMTPRPMGCAFRDGVVPSLNWHCVIQTISPPHGAKATSRTRRRQNMLAGCNRPSWDKNVRKLSLQCPTGEDHEWGGGQRKPKARKGRDVRWLKLLK